MGLEPLQVESVAWQSGSGGAHLSEFLDSVSQMPAVREIAVRSLDTLSLKPGERVLEVGCGTGVFLPLLAEAVGAAGDVVGIDLSQAFVDDARERVRSLSNVRVDAGDAYVLPYADASFDAAHCERVLMHLDDPTAVVREMRRVIRPGGRLVIAEPHWAGMEIDHPDHQAIELMIGEANRGRRQAWIGVELNRRFAEAGLQPRRINVLPISSFDYSEFVAYGLNLPAAAESLVAAGRLERARATQVLEDLQATTRVDTYFGMVPVVVARGEVP